MVVGFNRFTKADVSLMCPNEAQEVVHLLPKISAGESLYLSAVVAIENHCGIDAPPKNIAPIAFFQCDAGNIVPVDGVGSKSSDFETFVI